MNGGELQSMLHYIQVLFFKIFDKTIDILKNIIVPKTIFLKYKTKNLKLKTCF